MIVMEEQIGRKVYVTGNHPFAGAIGVIEEYDEAHECYKLKLLKPIADHDECFASEGCLRIDRRHEH